MGNKTIHEGYCHICNRYGKLTFEHIPPKCALNDKSAKIYTGDSFIKLISDKGRYPWQHDGVKYKPMQKGFGDYTLCSKCNNLTGELYGEEYKKWFYTVLNLINSDPKKYAESKSVMVELKNIYPGRFIRQILSIICSTYPEFSTEYPFVKELILNKDFVYTDKPDFKIYMYLLKNVYNGYTGIMHMIMSDFQVKSINEIDLYPFGFILDLSDSIKNEMEITKFINCGYDDKGEVTLSMNLHEKNNIIPLDFRTKKEIVKKTTAEMEKLGKRND